MKMSKEEQLELFPELKKLGGGMGKQRQIPKFLNGEQMKSLLKHNWTLPDTEQGVFWFGLDWKEDGHVLSNLIKWGYIHDACDFHKNPKGYNFLCIGYGVEDRI
tara:strand:- start:337 stop:648 length:312 start_codon:yes stop_codon:yes gene_type:complete